MMFCELIDRPTMTVYFSGKTDGSDSGLKWGLYHAAHGYDTVYTPAKDDMSCFRTRDTQQLDQKFAEDVAFYKRAPGMHVVLTGIVNGP